LVRLADAPHYAISFLFRGHGFTDDEVSDLARRQHSTHDERYDAQNYREAQRSENRTGQRERFSLPAEGDRKD
jgi:hypothetical protein